MNKKGADKILSIYWFVILIIVSGGVFAMASNFYGAPVDVREVEGDILADKTSDCISYRGVLKSEVVSEGVFNGSLENEFLDYCDFKFDTENGIEYFSEIEFFVPENRDEDVFVVSSGNENLRGDCFIDNEGEDYERLSKCVEKRFYSVDDSGKQYLIKVLVAISKVEKNVDLK